MSNSANYAGETDQVVAIVDDDAANITTLVDDNGEPEVTAIDDAHNDGDAVPRNRLLAGNDDNFLLNLPFHQQWPGLVATFCFSVALQQTGDDDDLTSRKLIPKYCRLFAVFAVAAFFMAVLFYPKFQNKVVRLLMPAGCFCGITAFFLAATEPLPFTFKVVAWLLYVVIIIASFFSKILQN